MPLLTHLHHQASWHDDGSHIWRRWSDAILLDRAIERLGKPGGPPLRAGAYVLSAQSRAAATPLRLSRLLGTDDWGVLDIGESTNLATRILSLSKCARGEHASGHSAGRRYARLGLAARLPPHDLLIAWKSGADSRRLEAETMDAYVSAFGELPPLNHKTNWRAGT